jgi:hypothetical protein
VFGKKDETYCAMIGTNNLKYREGSNDDILQKGERVYWITEAGSKAQDGTFENFVHRIQNNPIAFNENNLDLSYCSDGNRYELKYKDSFKVNEMYIDSNYSRFDSPYMKSDKKAETLKIEFNGKSLLLNFKNKTREY